MNFFCIHGNFGAPADWGVLDAPLQRALGGAAMECVDLWSLKREGWLEDLAQRYREFERQGGPTVIVGYSLGARLALQLTAYAGIRPAACVVCSVNPGLDDEAARSERRAADRGWSTRVGDAATPWSEVLAAWEAQPVFAGSKPIERAIPPSSGLEPDRRAAIARRFIDWSLGELPSTWNFLGRTDIPILALAGGRDGKFRSIGERIEALGNPQVRCEVIEGAGHRFPFEASAETADKIARFLQFSVKIGDTDIRGS